MIHIHNVIMTFLMLKQGARPNMKLLNLYIINRKFIFK